MNRAGVSVVATLTGAALLAATSIAGAFEGPDGIQALPCRPTIACTADLVPPGVLELEAGGIYRSLAGGVKEETFPFLAKLTLAKWLQLQLGSNGYTREGAPSGTINYFDNLTVGGKFHLFDQEKYVPSVSFSFAVSVPSAAQAGYAEYDDVLLTAYVSKDIGPLHVDINAGLNRLGVNAAALSQGWGSVVLSTSLPKGFGIGVENYYFSPATPFASRDGGGLAAVSYNPVSARTSGTCPPLAISASSAG